MPELRDVEFKEALCDRFVLAQEASGLGKKAFAESVGLTAQQLSNIARYRNPPPPKAVNEACRVYGYTTDFFYRNEWGGMRDPTLPGRLHAAQERLRQRN